MLLIITDIYIVTLLLMEIYNIVPLLLIQTYGNNDKLLQFSPLARLLKSAKGCLWSDDVIAVDPVTMKKAKEIRYKQYCRK